MAKLTLNAKAFCSYNNRCAMLMASLRAQHPSEICQSVLPDLMAAVDAMRPAVQRRLTTDAVLACTLAGFGPEQIEALAPVLAKLATEASKIGKRSRIKSHSLALARAITMGGHRPPPLHHPDTLWFASQWFHPDMLENLHYVRVCADWPQIDEMVLCIRYRPGGQGMEILTQRLAIWLCGESDDPQVQQVVDSWLTAALLSGWCHS